MKVTTLPKYSINAPPTSEELKRADELIAQAFTELENEPPLSNEEWIKEFEELREDIINQCRKNGTLNDIE
jgi:hypothetical protein